MRRISGVVALAALLAAGLTVAADAQETQGGQESAREQAQSDGAAWGVDLDLTSRYLWRGLAFSRGAVAQGDLWVSAGGFTASLWGNWDPNPDPGSGRFNEWDATLAYERVAGPFTLAVEYVHLSYPTPPGEPSTAEASFALDLDLGRGFTLGTHPIWDVDQYPGSFYGDLLLAKGWEAGGGELQAGVSAGWGSRSFHEVYYGADHRGLTVGSVTLAWEVPIGERGVIRPHAEAGVLLARALRDATGRRVVAGVGVSLGWSL
jgi:hypothetical protein